MAGFYSSTGVGVKTDWYKINKASNLHDLLPHLRIFQLTDPDSINAVIWRSQYLVDLCLSEGIEINGSKSKNLISNKRRFYSAVALWLDWLILGNNLQEESYTEFALYQPFAEIECLFFNLAKAIHPRPEFTHNFPSGALMWEEMRIIECQKWLLNSGVLTNGPLESWAKGKNSIIQGIRNHLKDCDDQTLGEESKATLWVSRDEELSEGYRFWEWEQDPVIFLMKLAAIVASKKNNGKFNSKIWLPFKTSFNKWMWEIEQNEQVQTVLLLANGEVFIGGKGKKIPKSKLKPRGFGASRL